MSGKITDKDVFAALLLELDHPSGYISKDPLTLDSLTVDGVISCKEIANFLNSVLDKREASK